MSQKPKNMQSNYDQGQPDNWAGTQAGTYQNTSTMKPVYPPCDAATQFQFAAVIPNPEFRNQDNYVQARFNADNQVIPVKRPFDHDSGAVGDAGQFGNLMFADSDLTGDARFAQNNVIEYGQGPGFAQTSVVIVSNDRADRGRSE
jgi:hypothetical protein